MGQQDAPTPAFTEGRVAGSEINHGNGRCYTFAGHYLGDGRIVYRATVEDADGEFRGELSGVFEPVAGGPAPGTQVESLLRTAIRDSVGYRP